jgi:hypothetical protein
VHQGAARHLSPSYAAGSRREARLACRRIAVAVIGGPWEVLFVKRLLCLNQLVKLFGVWGRGGCLLDYYLKYMNW